MVFTAEQIASFTGGIVEGDKNAAISTFAKIEEGKAGALSFLANPQYEKYLYETNSTIVLVNKDFNPTQAVKATMVRVDNAYEAVAQLLQLYESMSERTPGVSSLAFVDKTAIIGEDCYVAPFAYIGPNAVIGSGCDIHPHVVIQQEAIIGDETILYPHVTIYKKCKVGSHCIIHAGSVIGADGFGFAPTPQGYDKIPQIGIAEISDYVEIGANTCVDRSTLGATRVRKGVKLDNLVQIAHNVEIGENTVISSQAGVAGSAKVGQWCMLGGQVGVSGHIVIGDNTHVGAQSGIAGGNLARKGGATLMGYPAVDHKLFARQMAALKSLPEMMMQVEAMKKEIEELRQRLNQQQS